MRPGEALQRLVLYLERALSSSGAIVESPKRSRDRTTGHLREHDVLISFREGARLFQVAIECRDRSRPVGVPQVEAFHRKCEDTGVDKAVIVSSSGFCASAQAKAAFLSVECLTLEEAVSVPWSIIPSLKVYHRDIFNIALDIIPAKSRDFLAERGIVLYDLSGNPETKEAILAAVKNALAQCSYDVEGPPLRTHFVVFDAPPLLVGDSEGTIRVPVAQITAKVDYRVIRQEAPVQYVRYGSAAHAPHTEAAMSTFTVGALTGSVLFVHHEGGIKIILAPERLDLPAGGT